MEHRDREKQREYQRQWNKRNPNYKKEWLAKHPHQTEKRKLDRKRWSANNPEAKRKYNLKRYGLTPEGWDEMFAAQGGKCASCGSNEPGSKLGWHTDHCHETNVVRGVLCGRCNPTIGHAKEDVARLRACADYLEKHRPLFTLV